MEIPNHESPAFPVNNENLIAGGLTKREYIAALALQGLIIARSGSTDFYHNNPEKIAEKATIYADALLKELDNSEV